MQKQRVVPFQTYDNTRNILKYKGMHFDWDYVTRQTLLDKVLYNYEHANTSAKYTVRHPHIKTALALCRKQISDVKENC